MKNAYKILWAEDEDILREVVCELIKGEGFDCKAVPNGLEAKGLLEKDHFDLLISDFKMPELDGAHLLFWCRENNLHIPVIFVSATVERSAIEDLVLKDCCTSLIHKPFAVEDLLEEIKKAQGRNHEFECNGTTIPLTQGDFQESFPGQQYLKMS
ncbi:MAG: response regulator [Bacteriovoracia bacterium]